MSETMPIPRKEILNPQTTLLLEDIDSRLPVEEVGVLTESGRINKQGREIADNVYQEFLSRSNGNFKQVLELCREAESVLDINDPDSRDNEAVKIIQSVRGKVVYNAHRTWVEKQMNFDAYGMGDLSATNVMRYARVLKADQKIDVYEEATNIERERTEINEQLRLANEKLQQENDAIVEVDIDSVTKDLPPTERKSIFKEIKTKLGNFSKRALEPKTRRKIVAGALSTLAVAGIALGYVANLRNSRPTNEAVLQALNQPQVVQVEEIPNVIIPEIENEYLEIESEIPEVVAGAPHLKDTPTEIEEEPQDEIVEADREVESTEVESAHAEPQDKPEQPETAEVITEELQTNPNDLIVKNILEQENFEGILSYESDHAPENLVNLAEHDVVTLGAEVQVSEDALESVLGFINEADSLGYTIGVAYGYRSYDEQAKLHEDNPNGAAEAGHSQHQSGFAVDLYSLDYGTKDWSTMKAFPADLIPIAQKWGLTRPLAWDTPHFFALNAISPEVLVMLQERGLEVNPTDPSDWTTNFALNEILTALDDNTQTVAMAP
ncbi:hypothetical protein HN803_00750 [candidate division WWE3 bacterium]|jgi:LAS superfamily LD-carboxypeptidase LdcB|nr:hypothetical protein [candidate division WWE3 bacterium]MBT7349310.1 hypothetical protein [candidate division WWE3 bacterium]